MNRIDEMIISIFKTPVFTSMILSGIFSAPLFFYYLTFFRGDSIFHNIAMPTLILLSIIQTIFSKDFYLNLLYKKKMQSNACISYDNDKLSFYHRLDIKFINFTRIPFLELRTVDCKEISHIEIVNFLINIYSVNNKVIGTIDTSWCKEKKEIIVNRLQSLINIC